MVKSFFYIPDYYKDFKVESFNPTVTRYNAIGRPMYLPVELNKIELPEEPVMNITMQKIIATTPLAGYSGNKFGTVKQLITTDDYRIRITGILIDHETREYPEDLVRQLKEICDLKTNIGISSKLTDLFEIEKIVIVSANFPAPRGRGYQAFEIEALSDNDFELERNV